MLRGRRDVPSDMGRRNNSRSRSRDRIGGPDRRGDSRDRLDNRDRNRDFNGGGNRPQGFAAGGRPGQSASFNNNGGGGRGGGGSWNNNAPRFDDARRDSRDAAPVRQNNMRGVAPQAGNNTVYPSAGRGREATLPAWQSKQQRGEAVFVPGPQANNNTNGNMNRSYDYIPDAPRAGQRDSFDAAGPSPRFANDRAGTGGGRPGGGNFRGDDRFDAGPVDRVAPSFSQGGQNNNYNRDRPAGGPRPGPVQGGAVRGGPVNQQQQWRGPAGGGNAPVSDRRDNFSGNRGGGFNNNNNNNAGGGNNRDWRPQQSQGGGGARQGSPDRHNGPARGYNDAAGYGNDRRGGGGGGAPVSRQPAPSFRQGNGVGNAVGGTGTGTFYNNNRRDDRPVVDGRRPIDNNRDGGGSAYNAGGTGGDRRPVNEPLGRAPAQANGYMDNNGSNDRFNDQQRPRPTGAVQQQQRPPQQRQGWNNDPEPAGPRRVGNAPQQTQQHTGVQSISSGRLQEPVPMRQQQPQQSSQQSSQPVQNVLVAKTSGADSGSTTNGEGLESGLPPDWKPVKDASTGQYYYWNTRTSKTSWDRPVA